MFCLKEHLTISGFKKAVSLLNFLNKGINQNTLNNIINLYGPLPFLALPPVLVKTSIDIPSPWWVVGFIVGEGCFSYGKVTRYLKNPSLEGLRTPRVFYYLTMSVSQLKMDAYLLNSIANLLGHGKVYIYDNRDAAELQFVGLNALLQIILPFFHKYPLIGHKKLQFDIWVQILLLSVAEPKYSKEREDQLTQLITKLSLLNGNVKDKKALTRIKNQNLNMD